MTAPANLTLCLSSDLSELSDWSDSSNPSPFFTFLLFLNFRLSIFDFLVQRRLLTFSPALHRLRRQR